MLCRLYRRIRNPRDVQSGCVLIALSVFALWNTRNLPGMKGFTFGAGTAPTLVACLLGAVGALIVLKGFLVSGPEVSRRSLRGILWVSASVLFFAVAISRAGIIVAIFGTVLIASFGTKEVRWTEGIVLAALASALCTLLFVFVLQLPIPLWPGR